MNNTSGTIFNGSPDKDKIEELSRLNKVVEGSNRVIFSTKSVFPIDFFPDEIVIEENKIDIKLGMFFFSKKIVSAPIATLNTAAATADLFFGTLRLEIEGDNANPRQICFLWPSEAMKARRVISGLILCHKQGIDLSKFDIEYVKKKVEEIGATAT